MTKTETEADMPGLLGVLAVIGVDAAFAPALARGALAGYSVERARKEAFRLTVRAGMQAAPTGAACLEMPYMAAFETLSTEARLGLFLLSMLEFDLQDTGYILGVEPRILAARLDRALACLERATSSTPRIA